MQACAVASTLIRAPCPRPARLKQPRRPAARVAAYLVEPAAPTGGAGAGQAQVSQLHTSASLDPQAMCRLRAS